MPRGAVDCRLRLQADLQATPARL